MYYVMLKDKWVKMHENSGYTTSYTQLSTTAEMISQ